MINRGVERRSIFLRAEDYGFFLAQAKEVFSSFRISLLSYCLMPNHFHLLTATVSGGLSAAMHVLQTRHSMYFNRVYDRVGHLFQDRYKAYPVDDAEYLSWLPVYVHMNPPRANLSIGVAAWEWSGHNELASGRARYLDLDGLRAFGQDPDDFRRNYKAALLEFDRPLRRDASLLEILKWAAMACGIRWQDLLDGGRGGVFTRARLLLIETARIRGHSLNEIADLLGCSSAALRGLLAAAAQEKGQAV